LGRPAAVADGPLNVPITPASALQAGGVSGYARDGHVPWAALEEVIGALEGGRALTFSSGMAAATAAIGLFAPGAVVVAPTVAYMDVRRSLVRLRERGRAEVRFVDITDTDAVIAACDGADVLWLESPTNPLLGIADLPYLCAAARERGMLSVVDNTFATPLLQRPLKLGADVVVHSATKALGGHADLLLGAVVVADDAHFAALREARELGGATPGALESFLCLRGLRTLPLRLERSQHTPRCWPSASATIPTSARCAIRAWLPILSISGVATRSPAPGSCSPSACAAVRRAPMRSWMPSRS
jgi:cystathionine gamma-synthase